jgi:hypothetical protein
MAKKRKRQFGRNKTSQKICGHQGFWFFRGLSGEGPSRIGMGHPS